MTRKWSSRYREILRNLPWPINERFNKWKIHCTYSSVSFIYDVCHSAWWHATWLANYCILTVFNVPCCSVFYCLFRLCTSEILATYVNQDCVWLWVAGDLIAQWLRSALLCRKHQVQGWHGAFLKSSLASAALSSHLSTKVTHQVWLFPLACHMWLHLQHQTFVLGRKMGRSNGPEVQVRGVYLLSNHFPGGPTTSFYWPLVA